MQSDCKTNAMLNFRADRVGEDNLLPKGVSGIVQSIQGWLAVWRPILSQSARFTLRTVVLSRHYIDRIDSLILPPQTEY
jgi:hypothetical protein